MKELHKSYNPKETEDRIYKMWEKSGYFNPDNLPGERSEPFTITLPPPNVTGSLHIGHAYEGTLQDIMIRFERMRGKKALWVPGTDHAAIATQAKVEKEIYKKENKSRYDLGREEFVRRVTEFALASQNTILGQLRKMGFSLDWSRLAFTLDAKRELAVRTAFKKMFDAGLIYRDYRVINWDPKGQTTVSDDEVVHQPTKAKLYTFRYDKDFPIAIATTRPETKLGDTAVAVHPDDKRYKKFVGQTLSANFAGVALELKIIADEAIDPEFGTGAVGVTPAHSMTDWEISQRHKLPLKQVINEHAKITNTNTELDGKKTLEAREQIVAWINKQNLLEKTEEIDQNIATAERTGAVIEPLPKLQWFVNVDKEFVLEHSEINGIKSGGKTTLKDILRKSVEGGQTQIMPEQFAKRYFHWVDNLRDWCISRQIWFGHRIPVYYCINTNCSVGKENYNKIRLNAEFLMDHEGDLVSVVHLGTEDGEYVPSIEHIRRKLNEGQFSINVDLKFFISPPGRLESNQEHYPKCPICDGTTVFQDPDTLDTWFSSGLWTFSTLGWPEQTKDLKTFHPTDVMNPGYEILYLWVSRMIFLSGFLLGQVPFKKAVIHGIVRDKQGRKFSKSSGIGGDPLEVTEQYGTDALRMALVSGVAMGNDPTFEIEKVKGMKHFANKLWNIARFINMNLEGSNTKIQEAKLEAKTEADKTILEKLNQTIKNVTENLEDFKLHEAAQNIYQFTWYEFADIYLEASKAQLQNDKQKENTQKILLYTLQNVLKLLHPFMPFVTEEIYQKLQNEKLLMVADWPTISQTSHT